MGRLPVLNKKVECIMHRYKDIIKSFVRLSTKNSSMGLLSSALYENIRKPESKGGH